MKKIEFSNLDKILIAIILGLILVIITGTIVAMAGKKKQTPEVLLAQGKAVSLMAPVDNGEVAYFELGRSRIITKSEASEDLETVLVISPYLAYPAGDTVFYEELARKRGVIKGLMQSYFQERTKKQLLTETEEKIEKYLAGIINEQLSLGQISDIYFTDYIFLE